MVLEWSTPFHFLVLGVLPHAHPEALNDLVREEAL